MEDKTTKTAEAAAAPEAPAKATKAKKTDASSDRSDRYLWVAVDQDNPMESTVYTSEKLAQRAANLRGTKAGRIQIGGSVQQALAHFEQQRAELLGE